MALRESPNKSTKKGLVETFQKDNAKLYEALQKINADVDKCYEILFNGPIDVHNFDGIIEEDNLPPNIAFLDREVPFTEDQTIEKTAPQFIASSGGTKFGHFGSAVDDNIYIGENLSYNGSSWVPDASGVGALINLNGGTIGAFHWNGAALVQRYLIDINGVHKIGTPGSVVNAVVGDVVLQSQKDIRASNVAATAALSMIRLDANDLVGLGSDAANTGKGHVAIPQVTSANLPAAGASANGIIVIDKTNHRLCFYENGNRYYVAGTAF